MNSQYLNIGHKKISNKLPIIGISAIVIVVLGILLMSHPKIKYQISTEDMLEIAIEKKDIIRPAEFMNIYYTKDSSYRFIDLRSAHEFLISHIDGAINIPIHKLLDDEYENIFNQDEKINILYYSDQCGACGPWMILKQIGYPNNKVLQGGYNYVKKSIIDNYAPMSGDYSAEKAKYDYAEVIKNTPSSGAESTLETGPVIVGKKKKKREIDGGC
ncbi:MAG: rhodanese-like domain-containing protein [Bacteroidales bacterium]|nr:rhodanese-like domain-containing protein [Bacteroidales bacterium]